MKPLSHQESRRLFLTRIFGSEDGCPSKYEEVSDDILKRCGGLPLAVITIASLLAVEKMRLKEQWEYIRNCLISDFATNPTLEGMKQILNLSYRHLPRHLRPCFLYLGTYPEDHEIHRDDLVKQWVAEGFVGCLGSLDADDVAEMYFDELFNRNLIQQGLRATYSCNLTICRVHDMMLEFIRSKCREDNFLNLVDYSLPATTGPQKYKVRRLSIFSRDDDDGTEMSIGVASLSQVRSLVVVGRSMHIPTLSKFRILRVLILECWLKHEPSEAKVVDLSGIINQLFLLRYFKVFAWGYYSVKLPNRIRALKQLETLHICSSRIESIPSDIVLLPRLSHLNLRGSWFALPNGIGNIKSLRTLGTFNPLHSSLENINGLGELTNLRSLALLFKRQGDAEMTATATMHALYSSIQKLVNLKLLRLINDSTGILGSIMSSLSLPHHIEFLHLAGCVLPRVPRWLGNFCNLWYLVIGVDTMCKDDVNLLGELPSLSSLDLAIDAPVEKIVITCCVGFPLLRVFNFQCAMLSYLIFESGAMPSLQRLSLTIPLEQWDDNVPAGMEHLLSLQHVYVENRRSSYDYDYDEARRKRAAVRSAFTNAIQAHPSHPELTMQFVY